MPLPKPTLPPVAEPSLAPFDPWNSSSTGHQRAEGRGPLGWRDSRNAKLHSQFRSGSSGGPRISDTVGPGAASYDAALNGLVSREMRVRATTSVADMLRKPGTMRTSLPPPSSDAKEGGEQQPPPLKSKIFNGLVIYINGSTYPMVSDYRLKHILAENGARTSLHLGRRQVTHVILGRPGTVGAGAGGGLAAGKLEREIRRGGAGGVKFVGVEWVLESIKAGKRLPEARFVNLKIAASRQQSVLGIFGRKVEDDGNGKAGGSKEEEDQGSASPTA